MIKEPEIVTEDTIEEKKDNIIIFPYFQRIQADDLNCEQITEHYMNQFMKLMEYHGFDTENEDMINDMTVISMLTNAALNRSIGKSDNFQVTLDSILNQLMRAAAAANAE